jgi:hypothetical protein
MTELIYCFIPCANIRKLSTYIHWYVGLHIFHMFSLSELIINKMVFTVLFHVTKMGVHCVF